MAILGNSQKEQYGLVYSVYGNMHPKKKSHKYDFGNILTIYTHEQDKDVYDYKTARWEVVPQWDVRGGELCATKEECLLLMEHSRVIQGFRNIEAKKYYQYHFHIHIEKVQAFRYKYVCINPTKLGDYGADKSDTLYVYQLDDYDQPFSGLFYKSCNSSSEIITPSIKDDLDDWKLEHTDTVFLKYALQRNYNIETNMTKEFIEVYCDNELVKYVSCREFVQEQGL